MSISDPKKHEIKYRSVEAELNTLECDNEVANIIESPPQNVRYNMDFRSIAAAASANLTLARSNCGEIPPQSQYSQPNVCHQCECCKAWKRETQMLRERVKLFDAVFAFTPDVVAWFDTLRLAAISKSSLNDSFSSISNVSLGQDTVGTIATTTTNITTTTTNTQKSNDTNSRAVVPEIIIENIV